MSIYDRVYIMNLTTLSGWKTEATLGRESRTMASAETKPRTDGNEFSDGTAAASVSGVLRIASKPWFLAILMVILTGLAYQPVWQAGFIWDDDDHLTANPAMTAPHGLKMIWSSLAVSRYYPLTLTTFWLERRLWGLDPRPYHLVNVAVHAANGVLIFLLLRRWRTPGAWLAAMMWVLHPVNVESVAWITELKNTQSGLLFFLSILAFLRVDTKKNHRWYALALVCGLAAMLSKPSTVVLPVVLLLCVWWERGMWRRADVMRITPFFVMALGMSVLTVIEQRRMVLVTGTREWPLGPAERLGIAGKAIWFYVAKAVWPVRLTFIYPHWDVDASSPLSWMPLAAAVIVGMILWNRRGFPGCRAALFGWVFFVVALMPVLGFADVFYFRYSFVADHFQYLAIAGMMSVAAGVGTTICDRVARWGKPIGAAAATITLIALGCLTWKQAHIYRDAQTVWQDTLAKDPRCWMAHLHVGLHLLELGQVQEAIRHDERAVQIAPDSELAQYDLGAALSQAGRFDEAIAHFQEAVRIDPRDIKAHTNLGNVLQQRGRAAEAVGEYEQALQIDPDDVVVHSDLGSALLRAGQTEAAIGEYERAIRLNPDYAEAHNNLAVAFQYLGRWTEAIVEYQQAVRIKPDDVEARYNLGNALRHEGKVPEAIEQYEQALRLRPDLTAARDALAQLRGR
jgi:tetratricopeptide (TPR) repeat protein